MAKTKKDYLVIDKWYGGLADGSLSGVEGSFRYGKGLNYRDDLDSITARYALEEDTSSDGTIEGLITWFAYDEAQNDLYAYGDGTSADTGVIYKNSGSGWSKVRDITNTAYGEGLEIYDDYLYYRQEGDIGRYGPLSGGAAWDDSWKDSTDDVQSNVNFGPCKTFQNAVYFGNGRYLAEWDGATWDYDRLTFPPGWYVRDLAVRGDYLAICANNSSSVTKATRGAIFYWDGTSSTYNFFNEFSDGGGISAIQADQDNVWVFPMSSGYIYRDTGVLNKVKKIPFLKQKDSVRVLPGGSDNYHGMMTMGIGLGTSSDVYRGVYTLGRSDNNYPFSLNFDYPISTGTTQGTTLQIGALIAIGDDLYVGWDDDGNYGIDKLSTNYQTDVVYESRVLSLYKEASFEKIKIFTDPLANGESIEIKYKADHEASWHSIGTFSYATDGAISTKLFSPDFRATSVGFRLDLSGTTSSMPTVYKVIAEYNEEARL